MSTGEQADMATISALHDPERPWRPWMDMPIGDQRNVVREVRSEAGRTALAYWTGQFMAFAPISDDPKPLNFKVWGQRPPKD